MAAIFAQPVAAQTAKKLNCTGCVKSKQLQNNGIKSANIKNGQVKNADLGNNAVTGNKIADRAVNGAKVEDGSLTALNIASAGHGNYCLLTNWGSSGECRLNRNLF
jgi:hypothetical protein